LAQAPSSVKPLSLLSQAVAEIHLGRFEEAEAALTQSLEQYPENANVIANWIVLATLTGKDSSDYKT
jgi:coatomer protein complex subunit epsilon